MVRGRPALSPGGGLDTVEGEGEGADITSSLTPVRAPFGFIPGWKAAGPTDCMFQPWDWSVMEIEIANVQEISIIGGLP